MDEVIYRFFFGIYPYICMTVFLLGSWLRFDREQYTWRSGSSEMLRKRQLVYGSNIFHLAALALVGGHVAGMLTPVWAYTSLGFTVEEHAILEVVPGGSPKSKVQRPRSAEETAGSHAVAVAPSPKTPPTGGHLQNVGGRR